MVILLIKKNVFLRANSSCIQFIYFLNLTDFRQSSYFKLNISLLNSSESNLIFILDSKKLVMLSYIVKKYSLLQMVGLQKKCSYK